MPLIIESGAAARKRQEQEQQQRLAQIPKEGAPGTLQVAFGLGTAINYGKERQERMKQASIDHQRRKYQWRRNFKRGEKVEDKELERKEEDIYERRYHIPQREAAGDPQVEKLRELADKRYGKLERTWLRSRDKRERVEYRNLQKEYRNAKRQITKDLQATARGDKLTQLRSNPSFAADPRATPMRRAA